MFHMLLINSPNYQEIGKVFRQPKDSMGFSNFAVDFNYPDTINKVLQPEQQTEQETMPDNPQNMQATRRNQQYLFEEQYQDFKTMEEPDILPDDHIYLEIIKTIQQRNPVLDFFFSEGNVRHLQKTMSELVDIYSDGLYKISADKQRKSILLTIMRSIYLQSPIDHYGIVRDEVCRLNRNVLDWAVPNVISNVQQYLGYVRDKGKPYMTIDRPMNMSVQGTKVIPQFSVTFV